MATREEFAAFLRDDDLQQVGGGGNGYNGSSTTEWMQSWAKQQGSPTTRPPQAPKTGEQAPLIPPMPQSALSYQQQLPPMSLSQQMMVSSSKPRGHSRSRSEMPSLYYVAQPQLGSSSAASSKPESHVRSQSSHEWTPQSDPAHPFNKGSPASANRPPRAAPPPPPHMSHSVVPQASLKKISHRRAKSDIPLLIDRSSSHGGGRVITKADLLKNLPNPRWQGPSLHSRSRSRTGSDGFDSGSVGRIPSHSRNRSRTGSEGPLLVSQHSDGGGLFSYGAIGEPLNISGHGATNPSGGMSQNGNQQDTSPRRGHPMLQSIGSVELAPDAKVRHHRAMSDASIHSVTTDLSKSALFKGVTETGTIQLQLPKDSFRLLMDCQLEAGCVYKRKIFDNEDTFFVEFHTVDDEPSSNCHCNCDRCIRCQEKQKRLPPDLYVMAVDSTIYRRMLDEVIASQSMPCGTFFCGHHEDVRHPDITIAALIVGVVFFLLLAGAVIIWD